MFRIRPVTNTWHPVNVRSLEQIKQLLRLRFPDEPEYYIQKIEEYLQNPLKHGYAATLLVADNLYGGVRGFALVSHQPQLRYMFIDYLAVKPGSFRGGMGSALFDRVRQTALGLGCSCILLECLVEKEPDWESGNADAAAIKERKSRLRFYERLGVFPLTGTGFEERANSHDGAHYYLSAFQFKPVTGRDFARIVEDLLERKYPDTPEEQRTKIIMNCRKHGFRMRPAVYSHTQKKQAPPKTRFDQRILLTIAKKHRIHHVQARGYAETPVRMQLISDALAETDLTVQVSVKKFPLSWIEAVHEKEMVHFLRRVSSRFHDDEVFYPDVFPLREMNKPPVDLVLRAGYFCFDIYSPLSRHVFRAAVEAVNCALTVADYLLQGHDLGYALVRPPGHHAERSSFGGFCYLNSAAVAANYLSHDGTVAVLDLDYHHGNGTESIFYERSDVLTLSIHGSPDYEYPYFSGFAEDRGDGAGTGFNINYPLKQGVTGAEYLQVLKRACREILRFNPVYLIIPTGFDTAKGDPSGQWYLTGEDFFECGLMLGRLKKPAAVIQEGGYGTETLGANAVQFLRGLLTGFHGG